MNQVTPIFDININGKIIFAGEVGEALGDGRYKFRDHTIHVSADNFITPMYLLKSPMLRHNVGFECYNKAVEFIDDNNINLDDVKLYRNENKVWKRSSIALDYRI